MTHRGAQSDLFGGLTEENLRRIQAQNARRIPVILGNPPYNANQKNENDNNKNEAAPQADKRIKETYLAASGAAVRSLSALFPLGERPDRRGGNYRFDQSLVSRFAPSRWFRKIAQA